MPRSEFSRVKVKLHSPFFRGGGSAPSVPGRGPGVWGSGRTTGGSGAGVGGAAGALFQRGALACGWNQTGLLHLGTLQTW